MITRAILGRAIRRNGVNTKNSFSLGMVLQTRGISDLDGLQGVRVERNRKRLESVLKKKYKQRHKTDLKQENAFFEKRRLIEETYGFAMEDERGNSTVKMVKRDTDGQESVKIEFEAYKRPHADDETAIIMLFDIIVKQTGKSGSMVFTCTPDPEPLLLSVRFVPENMSYLDQEVFDGPISDKVPVKISAGLFSFLSKKGVDKQVFDFVKAYAVYKYETEATEGVNFASSFVSTLSP